MIRLKRDGALSAWLETFQKAAAGEDAEYMPLEKSDDELRYTLGPMYAPGAVDAHGEYSEEPDLRKAVWDYALRADKTLRKQHRKEKVGDVVELFQWPYEHEAELRLPDGAVKKVKLPAGTVYAGVRWTKQAWPDVKKGKITGYSMGGAAVRVRNAARTEDLLRI